MKKSQNILRFLQLLLLAVFIGVFGFGIVDSVLEAGGSIAKLWWTVPAIKVAVEFLPKGVHLVNLTGNRAYDATASVFSKTLEENLYPDDSFIMRSVDDTPFIVSQGNGEKVVVGVAGAAPGVVRNRSTFPSTITRRTDDDDEYPLDEFTTDAQLITITEDIIVRYGKQKSMLRNHEAVLRKTISHNFAHVWTPAGGAATSRIIRTTGANRAATAPSATGTRKSITRADIVNLRERLNRDDAPLGGRCLLLPATMESDLFKIDDFVRADSINEARLTTGTIGRILGFDVYMRSEVPVFDNAANPAKKAFGAAGATTDNLSALAWQEDMVSRALGSVMVLLDPVKAAYYGRIMSALARAGGKRRKDEKGVVALVEAVGS